MSASAVGSPYAAVKQLRMAGSPRERLGDVKMLEEMVLLRRAFLDVEEMPEHLRFTVPFVGALPAEVLDAMAKLDAALGDASLGKFCEQHLRLNELNYDAYMLSGHQQLEEAETRTDNSDFYGTAKVDTHLHMSAIMTSPELHAFLKELLERDGELKFDEEKTVGDVLRGAGFAAEKSAIDDLRTQATSVMFRDFEKFNQAFAPFKDRALKKLLFDEGTLGGRYLKEIIQRMGDKAKRYNIILEPRLSVKGKKKEEWQQLAEWFVEAKPEHENVIFAIQCPRVYHAWRKSSALQSFGELIQNFFGPLFAATEDPEAHPAINKLLEHVRCIDTVDNEAIVDEYFVDRLDPAETYTSEKNPPYGYWHAYFWLNLRALNFQRRAKGLSELELRPHCGEAGPVHHLASAFLFATNISHGINLEKHPVLQYLYYLEQIGCSVSPISNACLFIPYIKNPFPTLFKRGLRVTLTTDDPLMFHMSDQPQLEEYTTARHAWGLTMTDLSECARNSVLIATMPADRKEKLIGGEDPCDRCNVPRRRFDFRHAELCRNLVQLGLPEPAHPLP